jgi:hypothetical protein
LFDDIDDGVLVNSVVKEVKKKAVEVSNERVSKENENGTFQPTPDLDSLASGSNVFTYRFLSELDGILTEPKCKDHIEVTSHGLLCNVCRNDPFRVHYGSGHNTHYLDVPAVPKLARRVREHIENDHHQKALRRLPSVKEEFYSTMVSPIPSSVSCRRPIEIPRVSLDDRKKMVMGWENEIVREKAKQKILMIHFMIREMIANTKFAPLVNLMNRITSPKALDKKMKNCSHYSFEEYVRSINNALKEAIGKEIHHFRFYSILVDETTDVEGISEVSFYLRYLDRRRKVQTIFLQLCQANSGYFFYSLIYCFFKNTNFFFSLFFFCFSFFFLILFFRLYW